MIPGRINWDLTTEAADRAEEIETETIYRTVPGHYRVQFVDEPVPNEVTLFRDEAAEEETHHYGHCTCLDYHDGAGPCAHLWAAYNQDGTEVATFRDLIGRTTVCPMCGSEVEP